jgi:hypothetical protein
MKSFIYTITILVLLTTLLFNAEDSKNKQNESLANPKMISDVWVDANRMNGVFRNNGIWHFDVIANTWGLEWPKNSGLSPMYAAGQWIGAKFNNEIRVAGVQHSATEFQPGEIDSNGVAINPMDPAYMWYELRSDGSGNWGNWPVNQGAPLDDNGNPLLIGDQTIFSVWNDLAPHNHFGSNPLSIEVRQLVIAFDSSNALGDMQFIKWQLVNKSGQDWDSTYFTIWTDPDVGSALDDLVGCDTVLGLGYCYNGTNNDQTYGVAPPAIGIDFLQGPIIDNPDSTVILPDSIILIGKQMLKMTSFVTYNNNDSPQGNPNSADEVWNYFRAYWRDGSKITYGDRGANPAYSPTNFMFPGDPETEQGIGWLDYNEDDRRFIMTTGPFSMQAWQDLNNNDLPDFGEPGVQEIIACVMVAKGTDNLNSVTKLKQIDLLAEEAYHNSFSTPLPPEPPIVPRYKNVTLIGRLPDGPCSAVNTDGNYAYIGNGGAMDILDITNPAAPVRVGRTLTPGYVQGISINGDKAYIANGETGLRIIDISNPSFPTEIGFYDTPGYAYNVVADSNFAYVADFLEGLRIIDINNPASPAEVANINTGGTAWDLYLKDNYVYIAAELEGVRIIDVTIPASPHEVGFFDTVDYTEGVYVQGNYAYLANYWDGIRIIDISNPSSPNEVGYFDTGEIAENVVVSGNYAYVADRDDGLRIIDVSNPGSPFETGFFDTEGSAFNVYVLSNYAYIADLSGGMRIIDITNPVSPNETGSFETTGGANGIYVDDNFAYIADSKNGLRIIDISNLTFPAEIGVSDTTIPARRVFKSGNLVYLASYYDGLRIIDVSNPASPNEIGFFDTPDVAYGIFVDSIYAYVADFHDGLRIIDVSDPTSPTEIGFFDAGYSVWGIYVDNNIAYIACRSDGLHILDVSNPASPIEIGFFDTNVYARDLHVSGNYAYIADLFDGLRIIDISNPASPFEAGNINIENGYSYSVFVHSIYAYIAGGSAGLRVVDVSDPALPVEVGYYYTGSGANDVYFYGNLIYVADGGTGLYILQNDLLTGIKNNEIIPKKYYLNQNFPNPFNPETNISYSISQPNFVTINIFDVTGRKVISLVNEYKKAGSYTVTLDAGNFASGLYFYQLNVGKNFQKTKKMILLR